MTLSGQTGNLQALGRAHADAIRHHFIAASTYTMTVIAAVLLCIFCLGCGYAKYYRKQQLRKQLRLLREPGAFNEVTGDRLMLTNHGGTTGERVTHVLRDGSSKGAEESYILTAHQDTTSHVAMAAQI